MKFLSNRPLRTQAASLLALLFILSAGQFFLLRWRVASLNEQYNRTALARSAQQTFHQIVILASQQMQGEDHSIKMHESLDLQDHQLRILNEGGRIEGTRNVISSLSPLTKETCEELIQRWKPYRENLLRLIAGSESAKNAERVERKVRNEWSGIGSWYSRLINDLESEITDIRSGFYGLLWILVLVNLVFFGSIYWMLRQKILKPLKVLEKNTAQHIHTSGLPANEIADVATQVNDVVEQLKDASDFVQGISEGNLSMNYLDLDSQYAPGKNRLADSLINMQTKLKAMNDEEQRRKWANEGLTKFVDILRTSDNNISSLGDKIISALVHYTRSNQGGLYLLNDDDPNDKFLELISLFAFNAKKFEKQRFKLGEGILGQTFLEKETTYLVEIPEEYIQIRSGLGGAVPKAILAVPLKIDKEVYGIVELASFNEFQEHEISFVERLGETIASTLANVKASQRTNRLLQNSEMAAEEMRAQEEEMRQNMEELQATQEEIARKERDYIAKINILEQQAKNQAPSAELEETKKSLDTLRKDYEERLHELKAQLETKSAPGNDWKLAEEVEKALKMNLEALKITREELKR